ncbi:hypothetical protein DICPUDRAFT_150338 [Dictyostelium purpureum]|uniref:Uncharacterized protein n=1 Tax=Dictyostelium purpureum TaxID=5786 RepID=F0ZG30_DICPU|nr:uncharacterized protein DICPUDRAFT_150338 [Dictyostelium purpureum]EGC37086.1 hypothetical protein DICPUDRAFT_150338 [Dictyostelium purpureum]|eukprot:XP_003286367.1 hypothetical protein DICPUDRAFT_150338 [Dictyostelium purpureum]
MKLLLVLLFISFNYSFGQKQYINFIPYGNQWCIDNPYGVGVSVVPNRCLNDVEYFVDGYKYNSYFAYIGTDTNNEPTVYITSYGQRNCSDSEGQTLTFRINSCEYAPPMTQPKNSQYSFVTVTNKPSFSDNSVVNAVYSNDQNSSSSDNSGSPVCNNDNFLFATSMTDGLITYLQSGVEEIFSCKNGQPFLKSCFNNNCNNGTIALSCSPNLSESTSQSYFCSK